MPQSPSHAHVSPASHRSFPHTGHTQSEGQLSNVSDDWHIASPHTGPGWVVVVVSVVGVVVVESAVDVVVVEVIGACVVVVAKSVVVVVVSFVDVVVVGSSVVVEPTTAVVVVSVRQPPTMHASQQLAASLTHDDPAGGAWQSGERFTLQDVSPVAVVRQHVTAPGLPQVERAAQRTTTPLHSRPRRSARTSALATVDAHRT